MSARGEERLSAAAENGDEDDDPPVLSSRALEALREFLTEQQSTARVEEEKGDGGLEEVRLLAEDWRLSQFWYDRETAETIAEEIRGLCASTSSAVACVACPTIYVYLKQKNIASAFDATAAMIVAADYFQEGKTVLRKGKGILKIDPTIPVQLFEYDKRYEQYDGDFTFYDYNRPEELPPALKHAYQVVVADPPYLSKECLEKVAQTISFLAHPKEPYILLLTGEVQKERAAELLNVYPCCFRPQHSNKLGNEFRLYINYDPAERLGSWEQSDMLTL